VSDRLLLRIPARAEWVFVARLSVAAIATRLDLSVEDIEDLKLAVAEACAACLREGDDAEIEIVCELRDETLEITVADFDEKTEGLGLVIIKSLMESVEFRRDGSAGVALVMTKRVR